MDNTRLFLFAALAFVGMLIWQQWQLDYGPQPVISSEGSNVSESSQTVDDSSNIIDLPEQADGLAVETAGSSESTASVTSA